MKARGMLRLANPADAGGRVLMGRNYDFKSNTSVLVNGFKSWKVN